jgi:hypothetical protein
VEQAVQKAGAKSLRACFGMLSEDEQRIVKADGLTLVERLTRDKTLCLMGKKAPVFGELYMEELRDMYTISIGCGDTLVPSNDDEVIDADLLDAVKHSRAHGGSRNSVSQFLQTSAKAPSQSEVCGFFRHTLELKPHLRPRA